MEKFLVILSDFSLILKPIDEGKRKGIRPWKIIILAPNKTISVAK